MTNGPHGGPPAVITRPLQPADESNAVIDLIEAGRIDDAEQAAHQLIANYPEVHDGYDSLDTFCEERKDPKKAADFYRTVLEVPRDGRQISHRLCFRSLDGKFACLGRGFHVAGGFSYGLDRFGAVNRNGRRVHHG